MHRNRQWFYLHVRHCKLNNISDDVMMREEPRVDIALKHISHVVVDIISWLRLYVKRCDDRFAIS